jgi:zona occludens toxin
MVGAAGRFWPYQWHHYQNGAKVIELQTGLPGAGKTLYTLDRVEQMRKKDGRPVFYHGIPISPEKRPEWILLEDPKQWHTCPPGSIVVIDEAQKLFRPRPSGSTVPEYEEKLETHRHGGIDLILITQRPRLVSLAVRELAGRHLHAHRPWGMQRTRIKEWSEVKMNTGANPERTHEYKYNTKVFDWYKSAEAHTVKRSIPMKVWILGVLCLFVPAMFWWTFYSLEKKADGGAVEAVTSASGASAASFGEPGRVSPGPLTSAEYVAQFKPRVAGLHYTAPIYDDVTKPTRAPIPAACIANSKRCACYSQQGTLLDVPDDMCRSVVSGGFFVAWDEKGGIQPIANQPQAEPLKGGADAVDSWVSFGGSVQPTITAPRMSVSQEKR